MNSSFKTPAARINADFMGMHLYWANVLVRLEGLGCWHALPEFRGFFTLPLIPHVEEELLAEKARQEEMRTVMRGSYTGHASFILDGENHSRHLQSLPFGAFACIDPLYVTPFSGQVPDLRLVPFKPGNYDVYKITTSKAHGIEQLFQVIL